MRTVFTWVWVISFKETLNSSVNHSPGANDRISPEGVSLIDETNNDQSTKKVKCDFTFFFIINGLSTIENGSTALCCGNSELISVSLTLKRQNSSALQLR